MVKNFFSARRIRTFQLLTKSTAVNELIKKDTNIRWMVYEFFFKWLLSRNGLYKRENMCILLKIHHDFLYISKIKMSYRLVIHVAKNFKSLRRDYKTLDENLVHIVLNIYSSIEYVYSFQRFFTRRIVS